MQLQLIWIRLSQPLQCGIEANLLTIRRQQTQIDLWHQLCKQYVQQVSDAALKDCNQLYSRIIDKFQRLIKYQRQKKVYNYWSQQTSKSKCKTLVTASQQIQG